MTLAVFDEPAAESDSPQRRDESTTDWLRRSTRPRARKARKLLNDWAAQVDDELLHRLRSPDDGQFRGAFLETYLHETFRRADWRTETHPAIGSATTHPDFCVQTELGHCYVEATATNPSPDPGADRRLAKFLDRIDHMASPNFFLGVTSHSVGATDASSTKVKRQLAQWLLTLDPDDCVTGVDTYPVLWFKEKGWSVEFEALPIRADQRGKPGRTIGMQMGSPGLIADESPLTRALMGKACKYGQLAAPYIIAVDENSWENSEMEWHRRNALYGPTAIIVSGPGTGQLTRDRQNAFWKPGRNTRVSAVLLVHHLMPWNATEFIPELWINPYAARTDIPTLPHWTVQRVGDTGTLTTEAARIAPADFWGE